MRSRDRHGRRCLGRRPCLPGFGWTLQGRRADRCGRPRTPITRVAIGTPDGDGSGLGESGWIDRVHERSRSSDRIRRGCGDWGQRRDRMDSKVALRSRSVEDPWRDTVDDLCTAGDNRSPRPLVHSGPQRRRQVVHRVFLRCSTTSVIADVDFESAQGSNPVGAVSREIHRGLRSLHDAAAVTIARALAIGRRWVLPRSTSRRQPATESLADQTHADQTHASSPHLEAAHCTDSEAVLEPLENLRLAEGASAPAPLNGARSDAPAEAHDSGSVRIAGAELVIAAANERRTNDHIEHVEVS